MRVHAKEIQQTSQNQFMKFKVYVCTDKEHGGLCDPCTTEACYYKGIQTICHVMVKCIVL